MAKLTAKARKAIPARDFALGKGRYPIEDASHARNALARVSQHGTPAEKARVRAKVHEKYPGIGSGSKHMSEHKGEGRKREHKMGGDHREREGKGERELKKHDGKHEAHEAIGSHDGHMLKMGKAKR